LKVAKHLKLITKPVKEAKCWRNSSAEKKIPCKKLQSQVFFFFF